MIHWYVFYFFVTFSVGIVSLGTAATFYIKTKYKILQYYLYFYSFFTGLIAFNALLWYIGLNIPTIHPDLYRVIQYLERPVLLYMIMFTAPVFIHHLCSAPHTKTRNMIIGGITLMTYICDHLLKEMISNENIAIIRVYLENTMFMAVMLYSFLTGIYYYKKLQDSGQKRLAKKSLLLFGIFLPGIANDTFLSEVSEIRFFPVLYCGLGIVFIHHLIFHYQNSTNKIRNQNPETAMSEDALFEHYNISPREKEIIDLVLQGYSNQKIGETLYISLHTVKAHLRKIYPKFGINSRYELMTFLKNSGRNPSGSPEPHDSDS